MKSSSNTSLDLPQKAPVEHITNSSAFKFLCINCWHLEHSHDYGLFLSLHNVWHALPKDTLTRNKFRKTAADKIFHDFITHFGLPVNSLFSRLQQLSGIGHSWTMYYHLQNNPVKRCNHGLLQMLHTLEEEKQSQCKDSLAHVVHDYN